MTAIQQELYEAMQKGVICHYMPYRGRFNPIPYYFRDDTWAHCTAPAKALLKKGLVKKVGKSWRGHKLIALKGGPQ